MEIWILYFFVTIFLLAMSMNKMISLNIQKVFKVIFILWLIYFSTFRDGLGEDYDRYILRIQSNYILNFLNEPAFTLIFSWINEHNLSYIVFFFITSVLVVLFSVLPLFKLPYPFFSILTFLIHFGGGYIQSFNAIRQCVAVGLFIYAYKFIFERKIFLYILVIIFASFFHLSALLLIPVYWLVDKKIPKGLMIVVLLISVFFPKILVMPIFSLLVNMEEYSTYLNDEMGLAQSGLFLIMSVLFFILLIFKNRFEDNRKLNSIFNFGYTSVVLFNLSTLSSAFSRYSLYFMPFMYISLYYLSFISKSKFVAYMILTFFIVLFFVSVSVSTILPDRILPINSLWDNSY